MLSVFCSKCRVPASVVIQSAINGVETDQMRCGSCGDVWTVPRTMGSRAGMPIEPYARRRPDRRAQPR